MDFLEELMSEGPSTDWSHLDPVQLARDLLNNQLIETMPYNGRECWEAIIAQIRFAIDRAKTVPGLEVEIAVAEENEARIENVCKCLEEIAAMPSKHAITSAQIERWLHYLELGESLWETMTRYMFQPENVQNNTKEAEMGFDAVSQWSAKLAIIAKGLESIQSKGMAR